jgi:ubiquinone/menaquinone biosynthesis C-methylase UbiE
VGKVTTQGVGYLLEATAVNADKHMLDVACGPGYGAGTAAARGAKAIVVDFAPAMVTFASKKFPGAEFCEGGAENLPFDDARFYAVICRFGLLHIPDNALTARPGRVLPVVGFRRFPGQH